MASTQVTPTRMELTRTKKKLVTAIKGHKLLKDKRDELMRQFLDLVKVNMELREKVEAGIRSANKNFVIAKAGMDEATLNTALMAPKQEAFAKLQERGVIEVAPLAYMRGRTLDDSFIILDEAQNTTREQMKMFLTRLGFNSKMVITGDITQIDLPETSKSGLIEALRVLNGVEDIAQNRFSEKDVVRHRLVQDIVRAYEKYSQANKPAEQNKKPYQNGRRNA